MRVFLSYHTPDRAVALGLKSAIEAALPGADVFVDQTHLRHGHLWQPSLFDAIAKAQAFLILVSTQVGDWQQLEYYEALDRKVNDTFVLSLSLTVPRGRPPIYLVSHDCTGSKARSLPRPILWRRSWRR